MRRCQRAAGNLPLCLKRTALMPDTRTLLGFIMCLHPWVSYALLCSCRYKAKNPPQDAFLPKILAGLVRKVRAEACSH